MPSRFEGGCFCGAIRYECSSEPLFMINCHCRDCQRMSGSAYAAILSMPKGAFALVKGKPEVYTATADAGSTVSRPRSSPALSLASCSIRPTCCRAASGLLSTVNEGTHLLWANPSLVLDTQAHWRTP